MHRLSLIVKTFILGLLLAGLDTPAAAQQPAWQWLQKSNPILAENARSITADQLGNVYVTVQFSGTVGIDANTYTSYGGTDLLLIKYNASGQFQWSRQMGSDGDDQAVQILSDTLNNIYFSGQFKGTAFNYGSGILPNTLVNTNEIFLIRLNTSGSVIWARNPAGPTDDYAGKLYSDGRRILFTGYFQSSSLQFGNITLLKPSFSPVFLAEYDSSGTVNWAKVFGSSGIGRVDQGIAPSRDRAGNIYLAGNINSSSLTFGSYTIPGPAAAGKFDIFLVKFDPSANALWARVISGTDNDLVTDMETDSLGNSWLTGSFKSASLVSASHALANPLGSEQFYLARFDSSGQNSWMQKAGNDVGSFGTDLSIISPNQVIAGGYYLNTAIQFNQSLANSGLSDIFLVQYDSTGTPGWSQRAGGIAEDQMAGVAATACGIYMAASFKSPAFTAGSLSLSNNDATSYDHVVGYLARSFAFSPLPDTLRVCGDLATLDAGSGFNSYSWNTASASATIQVASVGRYKVKVFNTAGCVGEDSVYVSMVKADILQNDTLICKGAVVELSIDTAFLTGQFRYQTLKSMKNGWMIALGTVPDARVRMTVEGNWRPVSAITWPVNRLDAAYQYNSSTNTAVKSWLTPPDAPAAFLLNGAAIRPTLDTYRPDHNYEYNFITSGLSYQLNFSEAVYSDNEGDLLFRFYRMNNPVTVHWSTGETTNKITVSPGQSTTYYVTVSDGITTCTDSVKLIIPELPTLVLPDTLKVCGDSVELDAGAGAANYSWNTGAATQKITVHTSGKYSVNAANSIGCTAKDSVYVSLVRSDILQQDTTICKNASVQLRAVTAPGLQYSWSTGSTATAITVSPLVTTKYFLQVSDGVGSCRDSVQLTVLDLPQPSLPDTVKYCGTAVQLDAGAGFAAYAWNTGATSQTITVNSSGKYYVDVTGSAVCSNRDSVYVSLVNADILQKDTMVCRNGALTLNAYTQPSYTYQWSTGATGSFVLVNPQAAVKYYLHTSDGVQACTDSIAVGVHNIDTAVTAAGPLQFCAGQSVQLQAKPGYAYSWYRNGAVLSGATTASLVVTQSGNYKAYLTNIFGCTDSSSVWTITVNVLPQVALNSAAPVSVCAGSSYTFSAVVTPNAGGALQYQWLQDGNPVTGATASGYTTGTAGTYAVRITNSNGCSQVSAGTPLTINALPSVNFPGGTVVGICNGTAAQIQAQVSAGSGTVATLQWYRNGTAVAGAVNASITVSLGGSYTLQVTSSNGCTAVSSPVTVSISTLPVAVLTPPAVTKICRGVYTTLSASGGTSYEWYLNGQLITGATSATYDASEAGTYSVRAFNAAGCSAYAPNTVVLAVIEVPQPDFAVLVKCAGSASSFTNLTVTDPGDQVNYSWSMGDGSVYSSASVNHNFTKGGTYMVRLSAASTACPFAPVSKTQLITVEQPRAGIRYEAVNAIAGKPLQLQARNFASQYSWSPASGLNSPFIAAPVAIIQAPQTYTVSLTSATGCVTVDTVLVRLFQEREIYVPTAFTPNGDGRNDRLYPILVGISNLQYFRVYNRWGNLVFETNSAAPASGWDGSWKGVMQPMETYVWVAAGTDIDGKPVKRNGSALLIR